MNPIKTLKDLKNKERRDNKLRVDSNRDIYFRFFFDGDDGKNKHLGEFGFPTKCKIVGCDNISSEESKFILGMCRNCYEEFWDSKVYGE